MTGGMVIVGGLLIAVSRQAKQMKQINYFNSSNVDEQRTADVRKGINQAFADNWWAMTLPDFIEWRRRYWRLYAEDVPWLLASVMVGFLDWPAVNLDDIIALEDLLRFLDAGDNPDVQGMDTEDTAAVIDNIFYKNNIYHTLNPKQVNSIHDWVIYIYDSYYKNNIAMDESNIVGTLRYWAEMASQP